MTEENFHTYPVSGTEICPDLNIGLPIVCGFVNVGSTVVGCGFDIDGVEVNALRAENLLLKARVAELEDEVEAMGYQMKEGRRDENS